VVFTTKSTIACRVAVSFQDGSASATAASGASSRHRLATAGSQDRAMRVRFTSMRQSSVAVPGSPESSNATLSARSLLRADRDLEP